LNFRIEKKMNADQIQKNPFYVADIAYQILMYASHNKILELGSACFKRIYAIWRLVCKAWHKILSINEKNKDGFFLHSIITAYTSLGHGEIIKRFLKGVLIYKPYEDHDVRRIELPIASLRNPFEGTFDLSRCGDAGKFLSISTGYRKMKKVANGKKVEIWLVPRFLIEKELTTTAAHFQDIFSTWEKSTPVGIFWTSGYENNLEYYDYHISENLDKLSTNNLYEKCTTPHSGFDSEWGLLLSVATSRHIFVYSSKFYIQFRN